MKKKVLALILILVILIANTSFATSSVDDSTMYEATLAKALKIKDWMSSGTNRALLAFCLAANAADDKILGDAELLIGVMQCNPIFVGKDKNSENLIVATLTDSNVYLMYFSPTYYQAAVTVAPNNKGIDLGSIALETGVSDTCSKYYRITEDEMAICIQYIQSQIQ